MSKAETGVSFFSELLALPAITTTTTTTTTATTTTITWTEGPYCYLIFLSNDQALNQAGICAVNKN